MIFILPFSLSHGHGHTLFFFGWQHGKAVLAYNDA